MLRFPKPKDIKKKRIAKGPSLPPVKECQLQSMAEDYLLLLGITFIRIPDYIYMHLTTAGNEITRKFVSEYLRGIPDLTLIIPCKESKYNYSHLLELKTEKGKLSQGQKKWAKNVNVTVPRKWDEIKKEIDDFIEYTENIITRMHP